MATEVKEAELGGAHETASGMPQLDFGTFPNQIFWLLVALGAIYWVLSRVALPRIESVLAERQGAITNDIAAAEELKLKAAEAEKAYDKALADARAEANRITEENKAEMRADLEKAMERADAEIAAQQEESEKPIAEIQSNATDNVDAVAKETAQAIVAAFGGREDQSQVNAAVERKMGGAS